MKYTSARVKPRETAKGKTVWRGVLSYKDESGAWKTKEKTFSGVSSKREAERRLEQWRQEMESKAEEEQNGGAIRAAKTVGEYVERYIDMLETSGSVEKSTIAPYRHMAKHISAGLGRLMLDELTNDMAQAWVNELNKSYAPSTVRKAFNLLKAAIKHAVDTKALASNPLVSVKLPKIPKKEPNALDDAQRARLNSFLEQGAETPVNLAIRIALYMGMREQEVCGLKWKYVDFERNELHIREVIGRNGGKTYVKEPKTGGSRRDIPMPDEIAESLRRRRNEMIQECMEWGVPFSGDLFALGKIDGSYMNPHSLWEAWKALAGGLGLVGTQGKVPTFHDLRHTFATYTIKDGADVKTVSSILGHANAAMTLNVYASADAEAKRQAMRRVGEQNRERPISAEIIELPKAASE